MPNRPTILQIIPRLDTGGAELATIEISDAIVRAGGRALVVTEGGRMADRVTAVGGEIVERDVGTKNPFRIWANARWLGSLIEREDVDLLHARSRAPAWSALMAARRAQKPFVTTYHGAYGEKDPFKRLYNSVMARGDVTIANSEYTAGLIRSRYGTPRERISVIPRGVDIERFDRSRVSAERKKQLVERWNVAPDARVVLHAARLTGWKGQTILIDALAALAGEATARDAVVVMAGDAQGRDSYMRELQARAEAAGLAGRVKLVGHVDDIAAAYSLAWVTVVASIEPEAFGRAAAEALALGCPVITTNLGAPPEIVLAAPAVTAAETTGWVVPVDAAGLATGLRAALALSPDQRSKMGERAERDIRKRFTLREMQRQTLQVYDRILGSSMAAKS